MNRLLIIFKFLCISSSLVLAIYWYLNPSKNVEPLIVLLMAIPIAMEVFPYLKKKKSLLKIEPKRMNMVIKTIKY